MTAVPVGIGGARGPGLPAATEAIYRGQLARAKVARVPLLFVATLQSVGILLLLRGIVARHDVVTAEQAVAGATVLVVAFVGLNLLAQRVGALKAAGGLDYYAALPVPAVAFVAGTAGAYATFTLPGTVVTAVGGALLYRLPIGHLWLLAAVVPLAGASLAALGVALGLLAPRPEIATVAGQLAMSAVLFLDIIPARRLPELLRVARAVVPSTYAADALAEAFGRRVSWPGVLADLAVCAAVAAGALCLAVFAFNRETRR